MPVTEALSPAEKAERTAKQFLDRYVGGDGRVRRDPDGDTVSEGQAYAMLLAVAIGDRARFALVWNWTRANLLDPNGSLAWHWVNGVVVDHNAATDADVDAGRALLLAAQRFLTPSYHADGLAIATALLSQDVVQGGGGPVLVAGPWATEAPYTVNPSYLSPVAFDALAAASGDARWTAVRQTGTELLASVTNGAVTVSAVTTRDGIASQVFDDALTAPPAGQALVRFIHAAPNVPAVDVQVTGGPILASDVMYPWASSYQPIAPGTYDVEVKTAGTSDVLLHVSSWTIDPGVQSSIVVVKGLDGQLDVVPVRDASAAATTPVGGVQTDYGELAPTPRRSAMEISVYAVVLTALAAGAYCMMRFVRDLRTGSGNR